MLCLPFICSIHLLLAVSQTSKWNIIFCNHFEPSIFSKLMSCKNKISKPTSLVDFRDNVKCLRIFSPLKNYAQKWGTVSSHPKVLRTLKYPHWSYSITAETFLSLTSHFAVYRVSAFFHFSKLASHFDVLCKNTTTLRIRIPQRNEPLAQGTHGKSELKVLDSR